MDSARAWARWWEKTRSPAVWGRSNWKVGTIACQVDPIARSARPAEGHDRRRPGGNRWNETVETCPVSRCERTDRFRSCSDLLGLFGPPNRWSSNRVLFPLALKTVIPRASFFGVRVFRADPQWALLAQPVARSQVDAEPSLLPPRLPLRAPERSM